MEDSYSLHKITSSETFPFSADAYSRFKHGDSAIAQEFANSLFEGFIKKMDQILLSQDTIVLYPSPFLAIPTASNYLALYFKNRLNRFLAQHNRASCLEAKVHRTQTYVEDYGEMTSEERFNLISKDTYYIDGFFASGNYCIFLDDIKITGSHERTIKKILNDFEIDGTFLFVYFAELANYAINPKIENQLNYSAIQAPQDLVTLMRNKDFRFNTRVIKRILLLASEDCHWLCDHITTEQKNEIVDLAISNNYHLIHEYSKNLQQLII